MNSASRRRRWIIVVVVTLAFLLTGTVICSGVRSGWKRGTRKLCGAQMRHLALALTVYAHDNGEIFPDTLQDIYPKYLQEQKRLVCPSRRGEKDTSCNYIYMSGLVETNPDTSVMLYEPFDNHTEGANVILLDGRQIWIPNDAAGRATLDKLLDDTRMIVAARRTKAKVNGEDEPENRP